MEENISSFDPNVMPGKVAKYLERALGYTVKFLDAELLSESSRAAPWRINVKIDDRLKSYVLRLDSAGFKREFNVLNALVKTQLPTPRVYGWDGLGSAFGIPCFLQDFIEGESLEGPLRQGDPWAENCYLDAVCNLVATPEAHLFTLLPELLVESAADVLEDAWRYFQQHPHPIAYPMYASLKQQMPVLPELCFSNGDLWVGNFLVKDQQLTGMIDFANAAFSDPVYEFLLTFFVLPELRGRGLEARFCERLNVNPHILPWYYGLEYFDTLRWVLITQKPFAMHTAESLTLGIEQWLSAEGVGSWPG